MVILQEVSQSITRLIFTKINEDAKIHKVDKIEVIKVYNNLTQLLHLRRLLEHSVVRTQCRIKL